MAWYSRAHRHGDLSGYQAVLGTVILLLVVVRRLMADMFVVVLFGLALGFQFRLGLQDFRRLPRMLGVGRGGAGWCWREVGLQTTPSGPWTDVVVGVGGSEWSLEQH